MDGTKINTDAAYSITGDELRAFIERVELQRAEQAESKEREREIFAEIKSRGFMTRPIRSIIKERAQKPDDVAEESAVLQLYREALGMA
jgi:uncharacterized protein (UPF0335 family)